jgi:hypothetical protein
MRRSHLLLSIVLLVILVVVLAPTQLHAPETGVPGDVVRSEVVPP